MGRGASWDWNARARVKQDGAWAGASGFAAERAVLRAEVKGWA